jgi:hypothetical protein
LIQKFGNAIVAGEIVNQHSCLQQNLNLSQVPKRGKRAMERFALQEGSWIVIIAMFAASISLAGFTSKWLAKRFPALGRFGFLLFLTVTTGYFCVIASIMKGVG